MPDQEIALTPLQYAGDKNARVGDDCVIAPEGKPKGADLPLCHLRDGIIVIHKNGVVPHGTAV